MNKDIRFMNELFRIVSGALRLDIEKVRNYSAFLAEKLDSAGDKASAGRLRKLLSESDHALRPANLTEKRALPVDSESRFPLVERVHLEGSTEPPLILTPEQWDVVTEFLSIAKSYAQLESEGVASPSTFLLYGPPGVGKSRLARHISNELGVDLYVARLDGLVSSYLGNTAKNIRALLEFASRTPCVLFLDEFDAIAKLRGDSHEMGELKRVVNSFLQNLDALGPQSTILAATNHEELLDRAVWRRFSYRLHLDYPSFTERTAMWEQFLRPCAFSNRDIFVLGDLSEGFSGSDIREVALRLHRRRITSHTTPSLTDAFQALRSLTMGEGQEMRHLASLTGKPSSDISISLRKRDPKLYSLSAIASLLNVSKSTVSRMITTEAEHHE